MALEHIATLGRKAPELGTFTTLFTPDGYNPKADKGRAKGYATAVLYLAPSDVSGLNVCQFASPGCKASCLYSAGRGGFDPEVPAARIARTNHFRWNRVAFKDRMVAESAQHIRKARAQTRYAQKTGRAPMIPAIRPNGTSDLPWEKIRMNDGRTIFEHFSDVQFYDYTKNPNRALAHARGEMPANYHLTFSLSETNELDALNVLRAGGNVAVVFNVKAKSGKRPAGALPAIWHGYRVVDGDTDDLRFLDPRNVVVGLRAKGKAKKDTSGFVVQPDSPACRAICQTGVEGCSTDTFYDTRLPVAARAAWRRAA
jgi:hypothetical protein